MNQENYFFCYSTNLCEFLRNKKGQKYIVTALHDKTMKRFWLFERTGALNKALVEYNETGKYLSIHSK